MNPNDPNVVILVTTRVRKRRSARWRVGSVAVDVMPTLDDILGFSNRWYPLALQVADAVSLPSGRSIRLLSTPSFLAALPGHLPGDAASQERAPELEDKLRQIANLN